MVSTGFLCGNHDSKVHGANMGPIWGRQDPGGPHVGPMNFAIWEVILVDGRQIVLEGIFCVKGIATAVS